MNSLQLSFLLSLLLYSCATARNTVESGENLASGAIAEKKSITLYLAPEATTLIKDNGVFLFDYQRGKLYSYHRESCCCQSWPLPETDDNSFLTAQINSFSESKFVAKSEKSSTLLFGVRPAFSRRMITPELELFGKKIEQLQITYTKGAAPSPAIASIIKQRKHIPIHPICRRFDPSLLTPLLQYLPDTITKPNHTLHLSYFPQSVSTQRKQLTQLCP